MAMREAFLRHQITIFATRVADIGRACPERSLQRWLALAHVITAVVLAVTIIGIPFAWAHLKLAGIALWPIGKIIVPA